MVTLKTITITFDDDTSNNQRKYAEDVIVRALTDLMLEDIRFVMVSEDIEVDDDIVITTEATVSPDCKIEAGNENI